MFVIRWLQRPKSCPWFEWNSSTAQRKSQFWTPLGHLAVISRSLPQRCVYHAKRQLASQRHAEAYAMITQAIPWESTRHAILRFHASCHSGCSSWLCSELTTVMINADSWMSYLYECSNGAKIGNITATSGCLSSVPNNQLIATFDYLFDWIGDYSFFDCVDW